MIDAVLRRRGRKGQYLESWTKWVTSTVQCNKENVRKRGRRKRQGDTNRKSGTLSTSGVVGWWHFKLKGVYGQPSPVLIYTLLSSSQTSSVKYFILDWEWVLLDGKHRNLFEKRRKIQDWTFKQCHHPTAPWPDISPLRRCAVLSSLPSFYYFQVRPWTPPISSKCPLLPRHWISFTIGMSSLWFGPRTLWYI